MVCMQHSIIISCLHACRGNVSHVGSGLCIHHSAASAGHGALLRHLLTGGSRHPWVDQGGLTEQGAGSQISAPCGAVTCPGLCAGHVSGDRGRQRSNCTTATAHASGSLLLFTLLLFCCLVALPMGQTWWGMFHPARSPAALLRSQRQMCVTHTQMLTSCLLQISIKVVQDSCQCGMLSCQAAMGNVMTS